MKLIPLFVFAVATVPNFPAVDPVVERKTSFSLDLRPSLNRIFADPVHIGAFAATPKSFHLLVRPVGPSGAQSAVVELDRIGNLLRVTRLSAPADTRWMQVDAAGETLVWKRAHPVLADAKDTVFRAGRDGVTEGATVHERLGYSVFAGDALWGLTSTSCIRYGAEAEPRACDISAADPKGMELKHVPLSNAELVNDLVVESDQRHWASVMSQPAAQGASLLRLNPSGHVEGRFRCSLRAPDDSQDVLFPSQIAFANSTVFILDGRGLLTACQAPGSPARLSKALGEPPGIL